MRNSQRLLALGVFASFGLVLVGGLITANPAKQPEPAPLGLLPAAHAQPVEVAVIDTLHAGESISELLARAQLADSDAAALLEQLRQYQNPRYLQRGTVVSYRKSTSDGTVRGMEVRLDADRTLEVHRDGDGWSGGVEQVPVHTDTVVLDGSISSSLYASLVGDDSDEPDVPTSERQQIVDLLADRVFAWQIDFARDLQPGDRYRILYERTVRPDGSARSGKVLSAEFNVNHRDYEAYYFHSPDGTENYYQADGGSLKRAFLRAPLQFRRISSVFSNSRYHPLLKYNRPHYGIDYAAASGTPVHATADAVVASAGWSHGYGNLIILRHKHGYSTRYGHLRAFAKGIHRGVRVKQGQVIGYVGMTGLATGPHLHYEFRIDGKPVDPKGVKFITGDPLPKKYLAEFRKVVHEQKLAMDSDSRPVLLASASHQQATGND
ncbi:MAG TPA: M23 family metallopeptidase [Longimicrobiaceae bacterium]|nr:M23 family metallopeptidase [Longimicrobiaceae bacterium]